MSGKIAVIFTFKSVGTILEEGGTSAWRLDRTHARECAYALCTRNAKAKNSQGDEPHKSAFLIGRIRDVVPAPGRPGRYLIQFSEYAEVDIPNAWKGDRNPVRYASLEELTINLKALKWLPMPHAIRANSLHQEQPFAAALPMTLAEAKQGLALTFGVSPDAIEITIRG